MPVNRDKPDLWKKDVALSVDMYNAWFIRFAPKAFRDSRAGAAKEAEAALVWTKNLSLLTPDSLREHPQMLPILRMSTCPPIARDRLIGLSGVSPNVVKCMELDHCVPTRMSLDKLKPELERIIDVVKRMIDPDIFVWLGDPKERPGRHAVERAATIVADRLCGAVADPIIRNAQERRQLAAIGDWLKGRGYKPAPVGKTVKFQEMALGTFAFRVNVPITLDDGTRVNIPIDAVVMPRKAAKGQLPVLIEAKSAGDFTNVNKRRKEEAVKISQLRKTYGRNVQLNLFLCGYFDTGYLGYEAAEGIDWLWEHRIDDLAKLGL